MAIWSLSVSIPEPLTLVVAMLAAYRLTLLVVADEVTRPWRERLVDRLGEDTRPAYLLTCPWCSGMYVAPVAVASAMAWGDGWGWWLAAGSLAASGFVGALATYAAPND